MVECLLGRVLSRLGSAFGLLQLLNFGVQRLMRLQALLLQTLQQNLFSVEGGLRGGSGLGSRLGQRVLGYVSGLFGSRVLVRYGRPGLVRRSLRNRTEPTSGTVARLGGVRRAVICPSRRAVIVKLVVLSLFRLGPRVNCTWREREKRPCVKI